MTITVLTHNKVTWTNIVHPTPDDISQLSECYPQLHPLNLKDCLTELEFPKLDYHDGYLFLVVQFPYWDPLEMISRPGEVDIFITTGNLVTSHKGQLKPLNQLFEQAQQDETRRAELMDRGVGPLLYQLLKALVDYCFPILYKVGRHLRHIETQMFREDMRQVLVELATIRRDVIALRHILAPQISVIQTLEQGRWDFLHEELDQYWGDIGDHLMQLRAMLEENMEVVSGLSDTIDTLASHRIDEVVRLLTVVTVVTLPLSLVATLFGMNVNLPFSEHPLLFFLITGLGSAAMVLLVWYLRRKRWW